MTPAKDAPDHGRGNFLSEGFRELGRKLARSRLSRTIRQQQSERLTALTALGQAAWEGKVDLGKHAGLRDRLAGLDARAGELSQAASRLEKDKAALEAQRSTELGTFATRRKAVEEKKSPIDAALREARARKAACEQVIKQAESRMAAIAGKPQAERETLAGEQAGLATKLAASRAELPGHAAEDTRLAAESQKHAAEIAVVDAEQKAAIGRIDADLSRMRSELQGTTQQTGAVGKDRAGAFCELGTALYDAETRPATLADAFERVASIDRDRVQSDRALGASMAESRTVAGATMAKFWLVMLGVPLLLAAAGVGIYQYQHRSVSAPVATVPAYVAKQTTGQCDIQAPPDKGKGVSVDSNCVRREGMFAHGLLQSGTITYRDGRVAEGTFVRGQQIGPGKLTWKDGRRYEGMFVEGRSWGPGVFTAADGTRYDGDFEPGVKLVGIGMRKNPDGSVVVGEFVDGKLSKTMALVKGDQVEAVEPGKPGEPAKKTGSVEVLQ